jgi:hypothetical protein
MNCHLAWVKRGPAVVARPRKEQQIKGLSSPCRRSYRQSLTTINAPSDWLSTGHICQMSCSASTDRCNETIRLGYKECKVLERKKSRMLHLATSQVKQKLKYVLLSAMRASKDYVVGDSWHLEQMLCDLTIVRERASMAPCRLWINPRGCAHLYAQWRPNGNAHPGRAWRDERWRQNDWVSWLEW